MLASPLVNASVIGPINPGSTATLADWNLTEELMFILE